MVAVDCSVKVGQRVLKEDLVDFHFLLKDSKECLMWFVGSVGIDRALFMVVGGCGGGSGSGS